MSVSGLPGHPGVGPDDPGLSTPAWVFGVSALSGCPGEGPAHPGGVRMIRDFIRMIRAGQLRLGFPLGDEFGGGNGRFWAKQLRISWMESGETCGDA